MQLCFNAINDAKPMNLETPAIVYKKPLAREMALYSFSHCGQETPVSPVTDKLGYSSGKCMEACEFEGTRNNSTHE